MWFFVEGLRMIGVFWSFIVVLLRCVWLSSGVMG